MRHDPRVHPVDCPARREGKKMCNTYDHYYSLDELDRLVKHRKKPRKSNHSGDKKRRKKLRRIPNPA